ncbi:MAG: hypothetical protein ACRCXD_04390 [Luteolibacter sp.]
MRSRRSWECEPDYSDPIYSILEGVYDDYLRASFDNADSRRSDIEQLSEYAGNFSDILEFLQQLSLMSSTDVSPSSINNQQST